MKRVGIAGFLHESNSFSPIPTPYQHFKDTDLTRGQALLERWENTHHQLGGFLKGARELQFEPVPLMAAYGVVQVLDGNVLVPILFSEANDLHPIVIIAAVLAFGGLWGFWGVFFAIPLATLVKAVLNAWPRQPAPDPPVP